MLDFSQYQELGTADKLRALAAWYRKFAERAGNPWIWEARLRTAERLEAETDRLEAEPAVTRRNRGSEIETDKLIGLTDKGKVSG